MTVRTFELENIGSTTP